jgi:hypothetical protein
VRWVFWKTVKVLTHLGICQILGIDWVGGGVMGIFYCELGKGKEPKYSGGSLLLFDNLTTCNNNEN